MIYNRPLSPHLSIHKKVLTALFSIFHRITGIGSDLPHNMKPNYIYEFDAGISTFKLNKFIGGGIKSFRFLA